MGWEGNRKNVKLWNESVEVVLNKDGTGRLNHNASVVFTRGHCHSLALALHKLTGWPIFGVGYSWDSGEPAHCVVYCPELDDYVDIDGPSVIKRFPGVKITGELTPLSIELFETYFRPDQELAVPFAKTVLNKLATRGVKIPSLAVC
jgi:hypothetical protein